MGSSSRGVVRRVEIGLYTTNISTAHERTRRRSASAEHRMVLRMLTPLHVPERGLQPQQIRII